MKYGHSDKIKLTSRVPNVEELKAWCLSVEQFASISKSNYTQNRLQLWLFNECDFRTGKISRGYSDDRIKAFSQRIYPGCDIGLLTFHNSRSCGLISPHRDHSYAMPIAKLVNLGNAVFGYGDSDHKQYELNDGDVVEFNCKVLHSVPTILSSERFSIVFWRLNSKKGYCSVA